MFCPLAGKPGELPGLIIPAQDRSDRAATSAVKKSGALKKTPRLIIISTTDTICYSSGSGVSAKSRSVAVAAVTSTSATINESYSAA